MCEDRQVIILIYYLSIMSFNDTITLQIPYIYVPSKLDLGAAASTKRPTSCVLITPKKDFKEKELYDKLVKEAKESEYQNYQSFLEC